MQQSKHLTNSVVMVRPDDFAFNEQTGTDNAFQHRPRVSSEETIIRFQAMREFEKMVDVLSDAGLNVLLLDKTDTDGVEFHTMLPDAVFPNNWFSTTREGRLFIYPMKTMNRQAEVQLGELKRLLLANHFRINDVVDLRNVSEGNRPSAKPLEGTGALVFHHPTATIFAAISERCDPFELESYAATYGYDLFPIRTSSHNKSGIPIYHTNVFLSCGEDFAVVSESILSDAACNKTAMSRLEDTVSDIITITELQMAENFSANILQLTDNNNEPMIAMSSAAFQGFLPSQVTVLERHGRIITCPIPTIEYIGGGSVRCMLAEIFLPNVH